MLRKSPQKIAREFGWSESSVYYWLKKLHVQVRTCSEAARNNRSRYVDLSNEALEFLTGELLGDGHFDHQKWSSAFYYASKYEEYIRWIAKQLVGFGIEQSGKIARKRIYLKSTGKSYIEFYYQSKYYAEFKDLQKKWYRSANTEEQKRGRKFIKIIPGDLVLTSLACRQWYIGDASLYENPKSNYIFINMQSRPRDEINFLVNLLVNLGFYVTAQKSKRIQISTKSTPDFLNYIGSCPVKCYEYKWNLN